MPPGSMIPKSELGSRAISPWGARAHRKRWPLCLRFSLARNRLTLPARRSSLAAVSLSIRNSRRIGLPVIRSELTSGRQPGWPTSSLFCGPPSISSFARKPPSSVRHSFYCGPFSSSPERRPPRLQYSRSAACGPFGECLFAEWQWLRSDGLFRRLITQVPRS